MIMDDIYIIFICVLWISLLCLIPWIVHFYFKRQVRKGKQLSIKQREWMESSKSAGIFMLLIPIFLILFKPLKDKIDLFTLVLMIGIPGALLSYLKS